MRKVHILVSPFGDNSTAVDLLLMIKLLCSIIQYSHNVGVIVFIVIIKWIEEHTKAIPAIRWSEDFAIVITLIACVPYRLFANGVEKIVKWAWFIDPVNSPLTRPSAPILPRPDILKTTSTDHQSNEVCFFVQMAPFWLFSDGATRTLSELAIASDWRNGEKEKRENKNYTFDQQPNNLFSHGFQYYSAWPHKNKKKTLKICSCVQLNVSKKATVRCNQRHQILASGYFSANQKQCEQAQWNSVRMSTIQQVSNWRVSLKLLSANNMHVYVSMFWWTMGFYLLPPYSQNGTVPSFCAKYGGLNEYLYSNRWCTRLFTSPFDCFILKIKNNVK